jgi:GntR family transcriptional regulator, rspAB operon transcriptional repressor
MTIETSGAATPVDPVRPPTVSEQVFEALYRRIVTVDLPPGTRLSEVEVAKGMGTSRQPVRDAFWRLSKLGLVLVRPQRATVVTQISTTAVMQARFVRTAIEVETLRIAAGRFGVAEFEALDAILAEQAGAVRADARERFHVLDDEFHRRIGALAGVGFVWDLVRENKAHTDRVRLLSLTSGAELALADHHAILDALRAGDVEGAAAAMRLHLERISAILARIRGEHPDYVADEAVDGSARAADEVDGSGAW